MNHYHVDIDHALQVRDSAMRLFTALNSVHRLPPEYREWLSAAAMLYEVGDYVNRSGRHRHTHYVISHSEILGYTPQQRLIIAAIARYLNRLYYHYPSADTKQSGEVDAPRRVAVHHP